MSVCRLNEYKWYAASMKRAHVGRKKGTASGNLMSGCNHFDAPTEFYHLLPHPLDYNLVGNIYL